MGALERFEKQGDQIKEAYSSLQDQIFKLIIDALKDGDYQHVDKDDVVLWQAQQLQKIGQLNQDTMRLMAQADGVSQQSIEDFVKFNGLDVADEVDSQVKQVAPQRTAMPPETSVGALMAGIAQQTWTNLQNNVNESLVTTNYGESSVTYTYRKILTESTAATVTGLATHQDAVESAIYRAVDQGLPTRLIDKAGHRWSMEGYTNMVVNTTTHHAYNEIRLKRIKDFGIGQCVMSSHPASRPACAPIQGHVVNVVPPESDDFDDRYDSIYNHGYGEPWGTQGINCSHRLFPFAPGVSINHQPQYDPDEAINNGKIVQQQRARERAIRDAKHRLAAAKQLGDVEMANKSKTLIRARQKKLREFIKKTNHGRKVDLLHRDYAREKIVGPSAKHIKFVNDYRAKELSRLKARYGHHGFPETVQEYQHLLYNKNTGQAMHAYVQARKKHTVEPIVNYKDYIHAKQRLDKEVVGTKTSTGQIVKLYSDHTFDRIFGVRKDPKGKRRIGVSIDQIKQALQSQKHLTSKKRNTETYITKQARVIVNSKGTIVTLVPRKEK